MTHSDPEVSRSVFLLRELREEIAREEADDGEVLREISLQLSRIADSLEEIASRDGQELKPAYTVKEVAQMLGRSPSTIRRWIAQGKLESTKSTPSQQGQHLIPRGSLARFL